MTNGTELTVSDALITDSGRGYARLDSKSRKLLDVNSGDIIEIKGKSKATAAIVWPAHPSDEGLGFVRIDGYLRQNIGVGIGDKVLVHEDRGQGRREGDHRAADGPEAAALAGVRQLRQGQAGEQADHQGRLAADIDVRAGLQLHSRAGDPARHRQDNQGHRAHGQGGARLGVRGQDRRRPLRGPRRAQDRDTEDTGDGRVPDKVPRALREARHRAAEGRPPVRVAWALARRCSPRRWRTRATRTSSPYLDRS